LEFTSSVNGHRYTLSVALPFEPPTSKGYGVLYVLDGYWYFASAAEIVRAPERAPGIVVVGIGYPDDATYAKNVLAQRGPISRALQNLPPIRSSPYFERMYDLSLPTSDQSLVAFAHQGFPKWQPKNFGGLDDFLKTIERDVKPRVAALVPVDPSNEVIWGHSFGGYAVLHALFVEPNAFRAFLIASPAIHWDEKKVLADQKGFATAVESGVASPRVLVTVGGMESTPPDDLTWRMVDNGRELVAWLKSLHGTDRYVVGDYAVFNGSNHVFAPWPALAHGVAFAFPNSGILRDPKGKGEAVSEPKH